MDPHQHPIPNTQRPIPSTDPDEINLLEYIYVLVKNKWWIIGLTIAGLVIGYIAALIKGPTWVAEEQMGDSVRFLTENLNVSMLFFNGKPIGVELPMFVELTVTDTEPGVKGDTASKVTKPATLETGAVLPVPIFINPGDRIKVDTRTGGYVERAK